MTSCGDPLARVRPAADVAAAPVAVLLELASRYGTPAYAYDLSRLREQSRQLRAHLPPSVDVYYSLKANASLGVSQTLAECGWGADVASAGELATALEAGFPAERMYVAGPYKSPETVQWLHSAPEAVVSVDSLSELELLARQRLTSRVVLRLRPEFASSAAVAAGPESRFGVLADQLDDCRRLLADSRLRFAGFHVFAGSQVLDADGVVAQLRAAWDQARRAAAAVARPLELVNLGGGFGVPYGPGQPTLDLAPIGRELDRLQQQAGAARLVLELGRYLVATAGWYLVRVVGYQEHQGRTAVVVDGGTHQRADMCGLCLRTTAYAPLALRPDEARVVIDEPLELTDVLGCLSLPGDLLAEACPLPRLQPGDLLALPNSGAYCLWASAAHFHGYPMPAEAAFDGPDESRIQLMRAPQPARGILAGQRRLQSTAAATEAHDQPTYGATPR